MFWYAIWFCADIRSFLAEEDTPSVFLQAKSQLPQGGSQDDEYLSFIANSRLPPRGRCHGVTEGAAAVSGWIFAKQKDGGIPQAVLRRTAKDVGPYDASMRFL